MTIQLPQDLPVPTGSIGFTPGTSDYNVFVPYAIPVLTASQTIQPATVDAGSIWAGVSAGPLNPPITVPAFTPGGQQIFQVMQGSTAISSFTQVPGAPLALTAGQTLQLTTDASGNTVYNVVNSDGSVAGTTAPLPSGQTLVPQTENAQQVYQLIDSGGNYVVAEDTAGPGQPLHVSQLGQTLYPMSNVQGGVAIDSTSLNPGKYLDTNILTKIFSLLTSMISTTQNVAAAQAQRLNFLTAWQQAYTNVLNQMPTFIAGGGADGGGSNSISSASGFGTYRDALNQFNSGLTAQTQANQNLVSDDAKSLQSTVNQSNDAVNQQENMATSVIQQMNTLLTSIYQA